MDREILFRGREKGGKEWFEGDLSYLIHDKMECYIFPPDGYNSPDCYEVDPATVGQYIGVSDKFKKKLFEGDLVVTKYGRVCLIVWHDGAHCWDLLPVGRFDCAAPDKYDIWEPENLEKVGNRWDNPELLKVRK